MKSMDIIIKPVKKPPKWADWSCLSPTAAEKNHSLSDSTDHYTYNDNYNKTVKRDLGLDKFLISGQDWTYSDKDNCHTLSKPCLMKNFNLINSKFQHTGQSFNENLKTPNSHWDIFLPGKTTNQAPFTEPDLKSICPPRLQFWGSTQKEEDLNDFVPGKTIQAPFTEPDLKSICSPRLQFWGSIQKEEDLNDISIDPFSNECQVSIPIPQPTNPQIISHQVYFGSSDNSMKDWNLNLSPLPDRVHVNKKKIRSSKMEGLHTMSIFPPHVDINFETGKGFQKQRSEDGCKKTNDSFDLTVTDSVFEPTPFGQNFIQDSFDEMKKFDGVNDNSSFNLPNDLGLDPKQETVIHSCQKIGMDFAEILKQHNKEKTKISSPKSYEESNEMSNRYNDPTSFTPLFGALKNKKLSSDSYEKMKQMGSKEFNNFSGDDSTTPKQDNKIFSPSLKDTTEDPLCSTKVNCSGTAKKRKNGSTEQKAVKKTKSCFKPPSKQNSILDYMKGARKTDQSNLTSDSSGNNLSEKPKIINFFDLSPEEMQDVENDIMKSRQIILTVMFSNGETLLNCYHSPGDHVKDPTNLIILTSDLKCFQFSLDSKNNLRTIKEILVGVLERRDCETLIVNSKELLSCLHKPLQFGDLSLNCERLEDPVLASWLLNPDKCPKSFSSLCQAAHLKFDITETEWLQCMCFTNRLMSQLKRYLKRDGLFEIYRKIEIQLVPLLAWMENQPLRVDTAIFRNFTDVLKKRLLKLEETAYKTVGHKFSINSHTQLRQILYEDLKLDEKLPHTSKIGKTNVSHFKSTCESSLLLLTSFHPLPSIILEYRSLRKLKSTYMDGMLSCVSNSSICTHWDQVSAATGRITSNQPNIQNIPKSAVIVENYLPNSILGSAPESRAEIYAREPFIPHDGFVFLTADFQQIEFRILAHLSNDRALLSMFWNPTSLDVFILLTAEWKNIDHNDVSHEDREMTKRIVYSVMYGVGKEKLAEYLKVKPDEAKRVMQNFLARFPAIDSLTKKCCSFAKEHGYTETICRRRRYFPYINSSSPALRSQAQRQAVNFCIQGSAADICKLAMLEVESNLKNHPDLHCRLLIQIHDELLWEVSEDQVDQAKGIIENVMENTKTLCKDFCSLQVPLSVSFSQGKSWAHLKTLVSTL